MAWELDAQVLDFQKHRGILRWNLTVIAQALHAFELINALGQSLFLCFVCSNRISQQAVLLTLSMLRRLSLSWASRCCHHGISNTFRDNVETQHGQHDHDAGEKRLPPFAAQDAWLGSGQDVAPGSNWFLKTRTNKRQRGFQDDGICHQECREHQDWCRAVAHDVAGQNPWRTCTGDNHSVDVVLAVFTQHVRADNTGELWDVHKGDGTNNHPNE